MNEQYQPDWESPEVLGLHIGACAAMGEYKAISLHSDLGMPPSKYVSKRMGEISEMLLESLFKNCGRNEQVFKFQLEAIVGAAAKDMKFKFEMPDKPKQIQIH